MRRFGPQICQLSQNAPNAPASAAQPAYLTVAEAAKYARVSTDSIYKACQLGLLAHGHAFNRIRLTRAQIDAWLAMPEEEGAA